MWGRRYIIVIIPCPQLHLLSIIIIIPYPELHLFIIIIPCPELHPLLLLLLLVQSYIYYYCYYSLSRATSRTPSSCGGSSAPHLRVTSGSSAPWSATGTRRRGDTTPSTWSTSAASCPSSRESGPANCGPISSSSTPKFGLPVKVRKRVKKNVVVFVCPNYGLLVKIRKRF